MFQVGLGDFTVSVQDGSLPETYAEYASHARLKVEKRLHDSEGRVAFCGVGRGEGWPFAVLAFRYAPAGYGFTPGVLLVPETEILFAAGGTTLLSIDLRHSRELWEDTAEVGFWSWRRHGDAVLMSAELELAAWDLSGRKLWSTFAEPPWSYAVSDDEVVLDVLGAVTRFPLREGPPGA